MTQNKKNWNIFLLVWLALQVFAILVSNCTWEKGMYYPKKFFPFCGYPKFLYPSEKNPWDLLVYTYSYSEFFIYSVPALFMLYFLNRKSSSFQTETIQFSPADSDFKITETRIDPRLVQIRTKNPGLNVSVIVQTKGIGVPKFLGKTPISVNRYTYKGLRFVINGPNGNIDFYLGDENEYFFKI